MAFSLLLMMMSLCFNARAEESLSNLQKQLRDAQHDTTRIHTLFKMGDLYINGPSDSLLFYYTQALNVIRQNLGQLKKEEKINSPLFIRYQYFEIRGLIEFGIEFFYQSKYEEALKFYFEALEKVEKMDNVGLLSECYSEIGIVYKNQGKYDLAQTYYNKALDYAEKTSDTSWIASCKINTGNIYKEQGYLTIALNLYLEALKTLESLNHDRRVAACYQNIGDIYSKQLDFNKALEYYSRSLSLAKSTDDKVRENTCYLNIGYVYANMNEPKTAHEFYNKALELYEESGYSHELDDCYILFGDSYRQEGDDDKAIIYYNKALKISLSEQDMARQAEALIKLGAIYKNRNELSKAISMSQQGLDIANAMGSFELIVEASINLSEIYEEVGWHQKAFDLYKVYSRLKDSLFNAEKYKAITEMEVKYESEKKEHQLALLEEKNEVQDLKLSRRNRLYFATLIGIGLLLIIGYILLRNHQLRVKHRSVELEQKLMRSQMNPHFIFNSLIAIQSYIYKREAVEAGDYLAKFADLIRITLENSRVEFVSLEKEIKMLKVYIELQALRFDQKFDYQIELNPDINEATLFIPPMLAQPFIENAIEHGLRHKLERGMLRIHFVQRKHDISCIIEDNGVGREKSQEIQNKKQHQSMATSITRERLAIMERKNRQRFELIIEDLKDDNGIPNGTRVKFNMPYQIKNTLD
ncbi:MAG: DUF2225 domain-containing protein [Bacteroidales bacterium]|nr:DUF2225 domain-containing protein [Bacteroidales bacterium]MCF8403271.1 DUF2225 domain-containing protein [Bacteroidales bacterium]